MCIVMHAGEKFLVKVHFNAVFGEAKQTETTHNAVANPEVSGSGTKAIWGSLGLAGPQGVSDLGGKFLLSPLFA